MTDFKIHTELHNDGNVWVYAVGKDGNVIVQDEIEAMLNAAEQLSAVSAEQAANWVTPKRIDVYNELQAYAKARGGE